MKIFSLLLWVLAVLFLSPGALYENQKEDIPRLVMEAADSVVEPGHTGDWEAQMMAEDENLEITWGVGAGVETVREHLPEALESLMNEENQNAGSTENIGQNAGNFAQGNGTSGEGSGQENGTAGENGGGQSGTSELPSAGIAQLLHDTGISDPETWGAYLPSGIEARPVTGQVYSKEQLTDFSFLLERFFILDPTTTIDSSILNGQKLLEKDLTLYGDGEPQILIYHTHSQETYADSVEGDPSMTVQGVGDELARILTEKYGLTVLHNTENFDMVEGQLERSSAYSYAKSALNNILEEHPSIQVVIDLHRDGVREDVHLVTEIDGKPTAKIMFFNGMSQDLDGPISRLPNPYLEDNLAFSLQMLLEAEAYYPDFMRGIYLKCYRYNLHFRARSVLLEVGAQTNTFEEAINAMEPFADILARVILPENG